MTSTLSASQLEDFIRRKMRMSHIYQPVMLKTLLENGGEATVEQIVKALLSHDHSQIEYYGIRTKNMVGQVLMQNGVVEPVKSGRSTTGYRLNIDKLTEAHRASLSALCNHGLGVCKISSGRGHMGRNP